MLNLDLGTGCTTARVLVHVLLVLVVQGGKHALSQQPVKAQRNAVELTEKGGG